MQSASLSPEEPVLKKTTNVSEILVKLSDRLCKTVSSTSLGFSLKRGFFVKCCEIKKKNRYRLVLPAERLLILINLFLGCFSSVSLLLKG